MKCSVDTMSYIMVSYVIVIIIEHTNEIIYQGMKARNSPIQISVQCAHPKYPNIDNKIDSRSKSLLPLHPSLKQSRTSQLHFPSLHCRHRSRHIHRLQNPQGVFPLSSIPCVFPMNRRLNLRVALRVGHEDIFI